MRSVYDIRRVNLRKLVRQWGGPTSLAAKLGHSNGSYLAQLVGPHPSRELSERTARQMEVRLGLPGGWLDQEHQATRPEVDETLLSRCIRAVTAAIEAEGASPKPNRFAELVGMAYDHACLRGQIDETFINRLVRLTL